MRKKIINGILSAAILITGIIGFARLRYWERSIWIFKTNNEQSVRGGRFERGGHEGREFRPGPEDFRENGRADFRSLPDSVQQRIMRERGFPNQNDSIARGGANAFPGDRDQFRDRRPGEEGRGGHDFRRGKSVQLSNVSWFLAVFAGFTLITVYFEIIVRAFKQKRKTLFQK